MRRRGIVVLIGGAVATLQCSEPATRPDDVAKPVVLVGAGDITTCFSDTDEATASLLDSLDGAVFVAGDNLHDNAPGASYDACYEPTWGRHRDRTYPALGNHEYDPGSADHYFDYFGARAGPRGLGYHSFTLGGWHIIVLNSNAGQVPTARGSAQQQWLRADLAAHRDTRCTLAIFHHPRFYHGTWNKNFNVLAFWLALYEANADVVINGHFHLYERYAPQTPDGAPDPERGIRQFTVGTGGRGHDALVQAAPNVAVRDNTTFGVLKLTFGGGWYAWEFVPVADGTFADSGSAACH
jgi:hypothetical protein